VGREAWLANVQAQMVMGYQGVTKMRQVVQRQRAPFFIRCQFLQDEQDDVEINSD